MKYKNSISSLLLMLLLIACSSQEEMMDGFVMIPSGSFQMGSDVGSADEKPVHTVHIRAFAMSKYEVTFAQYDVFCDATDRAKPTDTAWGLEGRGDKPVVLVSWNDANAYAKWLSEKKGLHFRLPTEAEWEYAAGAGAMTLYSWGDVANHRYANYVEGSHDTGAVGEQIDKTMPVGSYPANAFGLYDMHGNVWEYVADCFHENYKGAPDDGSEWLAKECKSRVIRGGSWHDFNEAMRLANRSRITPNDKINPIYGFRLIQVF